MRRTWASWTSCFPTRPRAGRARSSTRPGSPLGRASRSDTRSSRSRRVLAVRWTSVWRWNARRSAGFSCPPMPMRASPRSRRSASPTSRAANEKRGPSREDPLGGGRFCLLLAVVDAVPERDVALRDPVQDSVRLRLRDHLVVNERLQPRLDADGKLGRELVLGHAPVLGEVAHLLALPQILLELRGRDVKHVSLSLEYRQCDRAAILVRVGLGRGRRGRWGRFRAR